VSSLASAIEELAAEDLSSVDPVALAADLVELRRRIDQLEAEFVRRVRVFDRRQVWAHDGATSTGAWLRTHCRLSPGGAHGRVTAARRLEQELPETRSAFESGEISYAHVQMISAATSDVTPDRLPEADAALVESARELDPTRFRDVVADWRHSFDAAAAELDDKQAYGARRFTMRRRPRGLTELEGELDPEGAATLAAALDALMDPPRPGALRTPRQRRADALVDLARWYLDGATPSQGGGGRPHLSIVVELETLERRLGSRAAQLEWAGPVCGETARRLACDADVSRIITDGASQPLDVGRRTRVIPAALRRAVIVRDRHCIFPGCDRPPPWADVHHFVHWADGGTTALPNLGLLCRRHHWLVHEGGWTVERRADGEVEFRRPGGRPLVPP
jgi:Domain of unknown function (DUF222)